MRDREWEEATEPMPGSLGERNIELGVDVLRVSRALFEQRGLTPEKAASELWPKTAATAQHPGGAEAQPDFVVFEPATTGLVARLEDLGYPVRVARASVDVMTLVSESPTAAVVLGPMREADQRRLLTAALKMRFPSVPVVYATSHASSSAGVSGAIREGAQAVLPWPISNDDEQVDAVLCGFLRRKKSARSSDNLDDDDVVTQRATVDRSELGLPPRPPAPTPPPPHEHTQIDRAPPSRSREHTSGEHTSGAHTTELRDLLNALGPILWNLKDAARWAEDLARKGDNVALGHASTLRIVARVLDQLRERLNDDENKPKP